MMRKLLFPAESARASNLERKVIKSLSRLRNPARSLPEKKS